MADFTKPKWHKDLEIFSKINSIIVIEGNVFDKFLDKSRGPISLADYLYYFFNSLGYESVVFYDLVMKGFYCKKENNPISLANFAEASGMRQINQGGQIGIKDTNNNFCIPCLFKGPHAQAPVYTLNAMRQNNISTVVVYDLASHLVNSSGNLTQDENESFTTLLKAGLDSQNAASTDKSTNLKNITVLLVNKINDLPAWFYVNNPVAKVVHVDTPSAAERKLLLDDNNLRAFFDSEIYKADIQKYNDNPVDLEKIKDKFVGLSEGFSLIELNGLRNLCRLNKFRISELPSVVDFYRFGIKNNPWESPDLIDRVKHYKITDRVKGQDSAMNKTMEVVKRAITGMSGIQHSSSHSKPRGVLFFAGPTGTGKTETAKSIAELIFRDEKNCIRFDMSEFSQPHSDQRLLGAPPGYVGYEAGGQLTNAVREHPFSILLFDEIEKAHPSILDKFLQILEDGRMTDGQGKTVYFSECIIIFTSNLGISEEDPDSRQGRRYLVSTEMDYSDIAANVKQGVTNYFNFKLGRPEILNRIGDNIVVFDFIRPESASQILDAQIQKICKNLMLEKNIHVRLSNEAVSRLREASLKKNTLLNGGRGIGNVVESYLVNPLSCYIFDNGIISGSDIYIEDISISGDVKSIIAKRDNSPQLSADSKSLDSSANNTGTPASELPEILSSHNETNEDGFKMNIPEEEKKIEQKSQDLSFDDFFGSVAQNKNIDSEELSIDDYLKK